MPSLRTRLFQVYARVRRPMTLGVRAAIENGEGHVFLVRHTYVGGWHMPGGGVERGEPVIRALERELIEEAGVRMIKPPQLAGVFSNHRSFRNDHIVFYRIPWGSWEQGQATSIGEIAETAWADPLSPPEGTTPGTRQRFAELYQGVRLSPFWGLKSP